MPNPAKEAAALGGTIGTALQSFAAQTGKAAARANAASAAGQGAAAAFNKASTERANELNNAAMNNQWGFNSGQAAAANDFSGQMWGQAAAWNEAMFNRSMEFNAEQAQIQREWLEKMDNSRYQRAIADMHAAGLNPILAATNGIQTGSGLGGSAASISSPQMSGMSGAMASGGLLGADSASISGYQGQMEYMSGILGLVSAGINGFSSALKNFGNLGDFGAELGAAIAEAFSDRGKTYQLDPVGALAESLGKNLRKNAIKSLDNGYRAITGNSAIHGGSHGYYP